ncbi:Uncharacterised protein (plasmid) [Legionella adelaidensis]|uniref:Ankyrin repeat protein n=1 Tax=Legionella adelaidensis TaxID=45056 RepID=A0A0W0R4I3_9GAMM|nr:DUF5630 domain-containing protein [Legionella adelaidensis]KTC65971.1 hypothetical protein Lade_0629 [Legionella adelaidensis]VEH86295.1 Uncharacterised protein [Legionella adelaidensis]
MANVGVPLSEEIFNFHAVEKLILQKVREGSFDASTFFSNVSLENFDRVVRLACSSPLFFSLCEDPNHQPIWETLYSQLGLLLSNPQAPRVFYPFKKNQLRILCADYLFYLSIEEGRKGNTQGQINFSKLAIKYGSIHAVQEWASIVYAGLGSSYSEKELFELIQLIAPLLDISGSYGYIMLAETYLRIAQYSIKEEDVTSAIAAAEACCQEADKFLPVSTEAIYNASCGEGLSKSNTYKLNSPSEVLEFVHRFAKDLSLNTTSSTP